MSVNRTLIRQTITGNQYKKINKLKNGIHEYNNKFTNNENLKKRNTKKN